MTVVDPWGITKSRVREFEGRRGILVMQPLRAHHLAYEAEEYPAMNESTTGIDIVPLPPKAVAPRSRVTGGLDSTVSLSPP